MIITIEKEYESEYDFTFTYYIVSLCLKASLKPLSERMGVKENIKMLQIAKALAGFKLALRTGSIIQGNFQTKRPQSRGNCHNLQSFLTQGIRRAAAQ